MLQKQKAEADAKIVQLERQLDAAGEALIASQAAVDAACGVDESAAAAAELAARASA